MVKQKKGSREASRKYVCPSCSEERTISEIPPGINPPRQPRPSLMYFWACLPCIRKRRAIVANPDLQNVVGYGPFRYAYFDQNRRCSLCDKDFVFSSSEQQYWYETLRFYPASEPNECADCRRKLRFTSSRTTKLSRLLPQFESGDSTHIEEIVKLYLELDKVQSAKHFLARAQKRFNKDSKALARIRKLRTSLE